MAGDREPRSAIVHRCHVTMTQAILELFEGFFGNFEDALFEYAYRSDSELVQQQCFNLMRELRHQCDHLTQVLAGVLERRRLDWYQSDPPSEDGLHVRARSLAATANAHFSPLLEQIADRMTALGAVDTSLHSMPLGPTGVAHAFLLALRARGFDASSEELLGGLFRRFVLDRLGPVYGDLNVHLMHFVTLEDDSTLSSSA